MESWRDNLQEKLSHTAKYEEVSAAADQLEASIPDMPDDPDEVFTSLPVVYVDRVPTRKKQNTSRQTRLDNALSQIQATTEAIRARIDEAGLDEELLQEWEEYVDSLVQVTDQISSTEFPRMYG